jgi:hypothetical protein
VLANIRLVTLAWVALSAGLASAADTQRPAVIVPQDLPPTGCFVVPGSYIRSDFVDLTLASGGSDFMVLQSDGTAYWYQGNAISFLTSQGTFTPAVGAWTCGPDDTVVVTTISYGVDTGDSELSSATRATYQLKFDRNDPDHPVAIHRVFIDFLIPASLPTGNFLDPDGGTVRPTPTAPRQFARVKALVSDLSR